MSDFPSKVIATAKQYGVQIRFAAMMAHTNNFAVKRRGAAMVAFISDCKCAYAKAHPEKLTAGETIIDHNHFSDFIVQGAWRS